MKKYSVDQLLEDLAGIPLSADDIAHVRKEWRELKDYMWDN